MTDTTWGAMDPNSDHQLWSRWTFAIRVARHAPRPSRGEVIDNARKYFAMLFRAPGQLRCDVVGRVYRITLDVEGPPAHDVGCRAHVHTDFKKRFMRAGFGPGSRLVDFQVAILAGDVQDGTPRTQLLVMPKLTFQ